MSQPHSTLSVLCLDMSADFPAEVAHDPQARGIAERSDHLGCSFAYVAERRASHPAVTTAAESCSYRSLLVAAKSVAETLNRDDLFQMGDRVILLMNNSSEYIAGFFGTLLAGGVVVPLAPDIESGRLNSIVESTEATYLLAQPRVLRTRRDLQNCAAQSIKLSHGETLKDSVVNTGADSLAAIFFTAGSSGSPKGVMLSHNNLLSNAASIRQYLDVTEGDRPLCVLPFYHAFGNSVLQSHLLSGAELILDGSVSFPETIIKALNRHQATSLSGVPDLFRFLLERSSLGRTSLPSLRYMAVAGGALSHELNLTVAERIAPAHFHVMYGQTEATARLSTLPPDQLIARPGCIGRGIPGVTLQVVDEQGQMVSPGEIGEIRGHGPNIMLGYWRDPETTKNFVRDGWLYTGDLATVDDDGWIFVKGRRSSFVKVAGFRVHPAEIEEFVVRRLAVLQAVVVPFEHSGIGTRLALFARVGPETQTLTTSEIICICRAELPRHMVPEHVQLLDQFPLTDALKIDRPLLTQLAEQATVWRRASA